MKAFKNSLLYVLFYLLPKNFLSCLMGQLVGIRFPQLVTAFITKTFVRVYKINMDEAEKSIKEYSCLQELFIRRLKPNLRAISLEKDIVICPCDGTLSIADKLKDGTLIQAKEKYYGINELLGDNHLANSFINGYYATFYLSPQDYHRFHVPINGKIIKTIYIPGTLWPVNNWGVKNIKNLFCQNERVITVIEEAKTNRKVIFIAVGAMLVGRINLNYCQLSYKEKRQKLKSQYIDHGIVTVAHGQELGQFMFGSTIILLFEKDLINGFKKMPPTKVKMGELLAKL